MTTETILPVTGGYDLVVTKVAFDKKTINPGDEIYASLRRLLMQVIETYQRVQSSVFSSRLMAIPVLSHGTISTMAV